MNHLTLLIFKDNLAARTFHVPFRWLRRFSWALSLLFFVAVVSSLAAVKYYRIATQADPQRLQDLQHELDDLKLSYKALESRATVAPVAPATQDSPTVAHTPSIATQQMAAPAGSALLFSALPADIRPLPTDPSTIPIRIQAQKAEWSGRKLKVGFNIQYVQTDGGSQQGRIIILARGPETLFAYPEGAISPVGSQTLLAVNKGEYFSVSRFREVRAEFGPVRNEKALSGVEILVISQAGQLIFHETLTPVSPAPAPRKAVAPAPKPVVPAPAAPAAKQAPTTAPEPESPAQ